MLTSLIGGGAPHAPKNFLTPEMAASSATQTPMSAKLGATRNVMGNENNLFDQMLAQGPSSEEDKTLQVMDSFYQRGFHFYERKKYPQAITAFSADLGF